MLYRLMRFHVLFRFVLLILVCVIASPGQAQGPLELRLSGTSSNMGMGDTIGLVAGLRMDAPLTTLTASTASTQVQVRAFGGVSGFRGGDDVSEDPGFAFTGNVLGYGHRTLAMAEAGMAIRAGWVELAIGPSVRYRNESFVRSVRYNVETDLFEATVEDAERVDIGYATELGVRLPVLETLSLGVHASVRRYDAGTQVAGLGLSASLAL